MSYQKTLSEHRRLAVLRFLKETPGYSSNASILVDVCNALGVTTTRDQVVIDLHWLADQGLVKVSEASDMVMATALTAGIEVAQGIRLVPGVKRPRA